MRAAAAAVVMTTAGDDGSVLPELNPDCVHYCGGGGGDGGLCWCTGSLY